MNRNEPLSMRYQVGCLLWLHWIGTLVGLVIGGMDHLYMVDVRGYDHTLPLGIGMAVTVLSYGVAMWILQTQYGGLLSHKRIYEIKEEMENGEGIERYIEWEVVGVDTYIVECLCYLVTLTLIVSYIYNMLLVTDFNVYVFFVDGLSLMALL